MSEFWLDVGAGMDAEHWAALPAAPGVRRVALDPLLTSGMVASGRLAPLAPDILRVGAEIRPAGSVETGRQRSYLPFRDAAFTRVRCGFMLHLYLEVLEVLAAETRRVLAPGGQFTVLLPHFGDPHSEGILRRTRSVLEDCFEQVETGWYDGPFTTFWADLYRDKTMRMNCVRK